MISMRHRFKRPRMQSVVRMIAFAAFTFIPPTDDQSLMIAALMFIPIAQIAAALESIADTAKEHLS